MIAVVAGRPHAARFTCNCCGVYRRCALFWIDQLCGESVRRALWVCAGRCRSALSAAVTKRLRKAGR